MSLMVLADVWQCVFTHTHMLAQVWLDQKTSLRCQTRFPWWRSVPDETETLAVGVNSTPHRARNICSLWLKTEPQA